MWGPDPVSNGPSALLREFLSLKGVAAGSLLSSPHSLGLLLSHLFICCAHRGDPWWVWVKHSAHSAVEHTQVLGLGCCDLALPALWASQVESCTVTAVLWGTVVPSFSYSWLYRSIYKLIKIRYLWIRLNVAEIGLIRYRFLGETKEKGGAIEMPEFEGSLSVSYTDDVILSGCVSVLWQHRFSKWKQRKESSLYCRKR